MSEFSEFSVRETNNKPLGNTLPPPVPEERPAEITRRENITDLQNGTVLGTLLSHDVLPASYDVCWFCHQQGDLNQLYKPCNCNSWIHRSCFRDWRTGWINPRNYFCCPNCMFTYNMKRVRPESDLTRDKILRNYRLGVAKIWLCAVLLFGSLILAVAFIAYFADRDDKNIPIGVRYMLTSIAYGLPGVNGTVGWREDFKDPDTMVWPFYGVLGLLCASIVVLITAAIVGSSQSEERRTSNCYDCCTPGGCCNGWSGYNGESRGNHVDGNCLCICTAVSCSDGDCSCDGCGGGGGDCGGGDGLVIVFVVVIVVVVLIVASAIAVIVIYAFQKWTLFYDEMCRMLDCQQREFEGETMVLGKNERYMPTNEV